MQLSTSHSPAQILPHGSRGPPSSPLPQGQAPSASEPTFHIILPHVGQTGLLWTSGAWSGPSYPGLPMLPRELPPSLSPGCQAWLQGCFRCLSFPASPGCSGCCCSSASALGSNLPRPPVTLLSSGTAICCFSWALWEALPHPSLSPKVPSRDWHRVGAQEMWS